MNTQLKPTLWPGMRSMIAFGLAVLLAVSALNCSSQDTDDTAKEHASQAHEDAELWTCGMHPDVILEEAGQCPICGMNLVPVQGQAGQGQETSSVWTCPMHPDVLRDEPGDCPICGMDLVEVETEDEHQHDVELWTCPMHPDVLTEEPGDCPICKMDLVPVETDTQDISEMQNANVDHMAASASGDRKILYWRAPMDPTYVRDKPGTSPMGMALVPVYEGDESYAGGASVVIDPVTIQNIGVQTAGVVRQELAKVIRTVGHVDYDEESLSRVNVKYSGWIERVYAGETGQRIRKGERLLEIYSPELVSTQEEYLLALANQKRMAQSTVSSLAESGASLVEASRTRLQYWDMTEEQITELERTGDVRKTITVFAPASGVIVSKMAEEGMSVRTGMDLYRIADLSTVWIYAHFYDEDVEWVRKGQAVAVEFPTMPGKQAVGTIDFIYPFMDKKARDTKVRIVLSNTSLELKPHMYANVELRSKLSSEVLTIPNDAVLRSGIRNVVFVDKGRGTFEPRTVVLGIEGNDGLVQVLAGLSEGENVVTSSQFLLDSESRLKEAIQKMLRERSRSSS